MALALQGQLQRGLGTAQLIDVHERENETLLAAPVGAHRAQAHGESGHRGAVDTDLFGAKRGRHGERVAHPLQHLGRKPGSGHGAPAEAEQVLRGLVGKQQPLAIQRAGEQRHRREFEHAAGVAFLVADLLLEAAALGEVAEMGDDDIGAGDRVQRTSQARRIPARTRPPGEDQIAIGTAAGEGGVEQVGGRIGIHEAVGPAVDRRVMAQLGLGGRVALQDLAIAADHEAEAGRMAEGFERAALGIDGLEIGWRLGLHEHAERAVGQRVGAETALRRGRHATRVERPALAEPLAREQGAAIPQQAIAIGCRGRPHRATQQLVQRLRTPEHQRFAIGPEHPVVIEIVDPDRAFEMVEHGQAVERPRALVHHMVLRHDTILRITTTRRRNSASRTDCSGRAATPPLAERGIADTRTLRHARRRAGRAALRAARAAHAGRPPRSRRSGACPAARRGRARAAHGLRP